MTTFGLMRSRVKTLTNKHISDEDINELLNRVHQEEVESGEWHYRQKHTMIASTALKTGGMISVSTGDTTVFGTGTAFTEDDIGKYIRMGAQFESMPIPIADVVLFPSAVRFDTYTVSSATAIPIGTTQDGVQGTKATLTVLGGDIRYTIDGTLPTTTAGHFVMEGNEFVISGHTNLDNFRIIATGATASVTVTIERDTQEIELLYPWPDLSLVDVSYEIFTRYYALPTNVDLIQRLNHIDVPLVEWTGAEIDLNDPNRRECSDTAYRWARAGVNNDGQKLVELWPLTTEAKLYQVEYLAGHTPMVLDTDRPLVPPTLLESKALQDAAYTIYAKTGDDRWLRLADKHEKRYDKALERLAGADTTRFGRLDHVLDLDGLHGNRRQLGWSYMVDHDV